MTDSEYKKAFELYKKRDKLISQIMDKQNEIKGINQEVGKINQELRIILTKEEAEKEAIV